MTDEELGFKACYDDLVQCRRQVKRLKADRNDVLEAAAEVADKYLDDARDPWEIPGEIRKLKEEP